MGANELMQHGETPEQKKNRNRRLELSRLNEKLNEQKETINALKKEVNFLTEKHEDRTRFPEVQGREGTVGKDWISSEGNISKL